MPVLDASNVKQFTEHIDRFEKQTTCPKCGGNWDGGDIYEKLKSHELYKNYTEEQLLDAASSYGWTPKHRIHFSLLIGIELPWNHPQHYDGISYWQCPHCNETWNRFTMKQEKIIEVTNFINAKY